MSKTPPVSTPGPLMELAKARESLADAQFHVEPKLAPDQVAAIEHDKRAMALLRLAPLDYGCLQCGFVVRGGLAPGHSVNHLCDVAERTKWQRKMAPPLTIGTPRPMLAIRRNGENFDVVLIPSVAIADLKVLTEGEALDYAMQKLMDSMPDELPFGQ